MAPGETFPNNVIPSSLLSPQAQRALAYMPLPSLPGLSNNYQARTPVGNTTDQTVNRVDQNLGDKARLMFRMAYQNTSLLQGSSNPFNGFNVPLYDRNSQTFGYTQTISPRSERFPLQPNGISISPRISSPAPGRRNSDRHPRIQDRAG